MENEAIGMIETKGLVALVIATDAMLKAAKVQYIGWRKVGSGLCTAFVAGDVVEREGGGGCRCCGGASDWRTGQRACDSASA